MPYGARWWQVLSSAYICSFSDLEIQAVLLDQLMREPEAPSKEYLLKFETKSLRDTRELLEKGKNLADATAFVEENPNPRLWRQLETGSNPLHIRISVGRCKLTVYE